jgi:hypothetical protein
MYRVCSLLRTLREVWLENDDALLTSGFSLYSQRRLGYTEAT